MIHYMRQLSVYIVLSAVTIAACATRTARRDEPQASPGAGRRAEMSAPLPFDDAVTKRRLENGFTYYIRANHKPENRMELRLVVRAGSVLEDDDQQGLAHFLEHMAFNGTEHFEKQELVDYLESIGMRFGPDVNASTGFDQTVYMLQVPTDDAGIVATAFQILEDWAHNMTLDGGEIDRERGVIIEEWRQGRGAAARMRDKQLPVLFDGSRYAERLPIGKPEIIRNFDHDTLRRFYRDWYRPDLMAVVAVGDFDPDVIERNIREHFSRLAMPDDPPERTVYPVPDHEDILFAIATDPEAAGSNAAVYYKHDVRPETTERDYRRSIVESLYNGMFNMRLTELSRQSDPPFLYGYSGSGRFVLSKEIYMLGVGVEDNGIPRGLEAIYTEAERVARHGFTATELERQKKERLRGMERAYNERDKTESGAYANEYVRNFTVDEPVPGIEAEFELHRRFLSDITLDEVNRLAGSLITDDNRVVMIGSPEKPDVSVPDEAGILAILESVEGKTIEPYEDEVDDRPLVSETPEPSPVVDENRIEEIGVTEWRLANGVRVVLKPTDFKNDEIRFTSYSPGGHSLVDRDGYIPAVTAASLMREGGIDGFDRNGLDKKLSGKVVSVGPWIDELQEGISGGASPRDAETMFRLIYLYFTEPRKDPEAFQSYLSRMNGYIENRSASPETAFFDTLGVTLAGYHYRSRPWSPELLAEMDLDASYAIYRDRFADAGDFTFFFVGNFDPAAIRPLVETWLGGLPAAGREETWRDVGIDYPKGVVEKTVNRGIEQKSRVSIVFTGAIPWSRQNRYTIGSMTDALQIKLREVLREDLGGTYSVGVSQSVFHYPDEEYRITVSFGADPGRVDELTSVVFAQIDSLRTVGIDQSYIDKVRETQRREREINLENNDFWLNILKTYYYHGEDPVDILAFDELIDSLDVDAVRRMANRCFDMNRYVKVVLYPENE